MTRDIPLVADELELNTTVPPPALVSVSDPAESGPLSVTRAPAPMLNDPLAPSAMAGAMSVAPPPLTSSPFAPSVIVLTPVIEYSPLELSISRPEVLAPVLTDGFETEPLSGKIASTEPLGTPAV